MPRCIVQRDTQDEMWSLSKFTSPEIATYTSACWLADWNHNNTFIPDDLQQITGLVTKAAYDKAMDGLESRGLIMIGVGDVTLCDPYTGLEILPIDDEMENLQNQHTTINGVIHPTVFNFEKTPEFMEKLGTVLGIEFTKSGKNYKTLCLYHTDTRPSLCVDPRGLGQFYCYGCKQAGTLSDIVMKVRGFKNRKDALVFMVEVNGAESHYVDPDHNYTIYSYRDKMGFLKKQEMRHKFKDKSFTQRIPVGAGWEYKQGPPMLYNLDKLQIADTIFMVEGPKDCETIGRHIHDPFIVATTTGGAGTWDDSCADDLVGKRVVLMPDN